MGRTVHKFRKKPIEIEAYRLTAEMLAGQAPIPMVYPHLDLVKNDAGGWRPVLRIQTLEGVMTAEEGDWIIQGVEGECYPCKHSIFQATYETI